jgi:hypothetical protein
MFSSSNGSWPISSLFTRSGGPNCFTVTTLRGSIIKAFYVFKRITNNGTKRFFLWAPFRPLNHMETKSNQVAESVTVRNGNIKLVRIKENSSISSISEAISFVSRNMRPMLISRNSLAHT